MTATMTITAKSPAQPYTSRNVDASPQEIIAAARSAPAPMLAALGCGVVSAVLQWCSFTPLDWGWLGWVSLLPLLLLVRMERPTRAMTWAVYLSGCVFWFPTLQWLRLGDPSMYPAWMAMAAYVAAYFPVAIWLTRRAVWGWKWPLAIAAPVVWTGLDLFRAYFLTGFAWYFLGHTQHRWIDLIQVCDLAGVYGLTFLIVIPQAIAAEMIPTTWLAKLKLLPPALSVNESMLRAADQGRQTGWYVKRIAAALMLVGLAVGYGMWQRSGEPYKPGLRVAAIQGNFRAVINPDPQESPRIHHRHMILTGQAVKQQPDIIIWPEGMFRWPLVDAPAGVTDEALQAKFPDVNFGWLRKLGVEKTLTDMSQMGGAAMFINLTTISAIDARMKYYNSAVFIRPDTGIVGRYDKIHRVPFGEYVPATDWLPFLAWIAPFGEEYGISAGTQPMAYEYKGCRIAPIICYEDTVPQVVRKIVLEARAAQITAGKDVQEMGSANNGRGVDLLVNLSNDGWFQGSSEHDQHLITAQFRCIETRTPMVRAVNTGVSAIIDGEGVVRKRAEDLETGKSKLVESVVIDTVPQDGRYSVYLAVGDWPAGVCLMLCGLLGLSSVWNWLRGRSRVTTHHLSAATA